MIPFDIGDPATYPGKAGSVSNQLAYKQGMLLVINDSPYQLRIRPSSSDTYFTVPPTAPREVPLKAGDFTIDWLVTGTLAASNPPISDVALEFYEPGEEIPAYPMTFVRQANVGNTVTTTAIAQVINDGNTAPTTVVEATPSGGGGSQLLLHNDGSGLLGGGHIAIDNAGNITGASLAASEIGAGYPAANLGAGTLAAGVTVPAAQVSGTVASATNATNLTGGTLSSTGAASLDGGTLTTNGAGTISKIVQIVWNSTLSAGNKLMDLMQSYGLWSDNVGTGLGTTRLWIDGPDQGELQLGPRNGSNFFDWVRMRATRVTVALGHNASANTILFEVTGGPTHLDNAAIETDGGGNVIAVGSITSAAGALSLGGAITKVGGQASAGNFGVPVIVAQTITQSVTTTTQQTILSYTPPANGFFRANLYISNSDSSNPTIVAALVWKDVPFAASKNTNFSAPVIFGGNAPVVLNGATAINTGVMIACHPLTVYAAAGTAIQILYQVGSGTPSDRVTAILERLA